jgi:hypothetical protein
MIPCYSLFLEVEVPDPAKNYFIIAQDELDNTEHLMAPPPLGQDNISIATVLPGANEDLVLWDDDNAYFAMLKQDSGTFVDWRWNAVASRYEFYGKAYWENRRDVAGEIRGVSSLASNYNFFADFVTPDDPQINESREIMWVTDDYPGQIDDYEIQFRWDDNVVESKTMHVLLPTMESPEKVPDQPNQPDAVRNNPVQPEPCRLSGNNTFTLNTSCLNGDVDLLEGWGSSKPDHIWVDVITDTTDINIERGFDMKQGVVGTPIAGVMEANILDPYLAGINTSIVAVGQRVRLRAGNEVVFSGICNAVRSEYDAVNTPVLRIEAVDALGLLNAQMVSERPQEGYNTRMLEAASKVDLPLIQEISTTELNPTEDPMSALELLVETQDSEGSVVWLDRFGTMYSTNRYWLDTLDIPIFRNSRFSAAPRFTFTNNPKEEIGIYSTEQVCLSQYKQVSDTSQVINGITFYNYTEVDDTDFEGLPIKTIVRDTHTFESATSRRLYGDAGVKLTTYLPETDLVGYADYIFANYDTPKTKVETIQFPLDKWDSLAVPDMVSLDIGEPLLVRIDDPYTQHTMNTAVQRIAQIRHRITPLEWLCELDLL